MRFELVRNLKGDEILGKTLMDASGSVLLMAGTRLTRLYINRLRDHGIFSLYVEDKNLEDIKQDEKILSLKQTALQVLPRIFNGLSSGNKESFFDSYFVIKDLVDYIIEEGDVHTNLYEISHYDNYTYIHCVDTCIMATFLGISLNLSRASLKLLGESAILHDIGKINISEEIINKKSKLTDLEYDEIKKHPNYGYRILEEAGITTEPVLHGVLQHHERIDGQGYPFQKNREEISYFAKIISVCDVFTALSSNRCYRPRFNPNEAYEYILSNAGVAFDEQIVLKFKKVFSIYPLGCCVKLSNDIEGFVVNQNSNFPDRPVIRVLYDYITHKKIPAYEINLLEKTYLTIVSVVERPA